MAAVYRLRQGVRALLAFTRTVDADLVARYLSPELVAVFGRLSKGEQLHSVAVLRVVLAQAPQTPHDLAVAALLHDIGKTRYRLAVWQKTLAVLVRKAAHAQYRRLSMGERVTFWRAPFMVAEQHPAWGEHLLAEYGVSERALWLVAHHADNAAQWRNHPHYALLVRLQQADNSA